MRVVFAPEALDDLVEIAAYIAEDSPRAARQVAAGLKAKASDLSSMAERFPVIGVRDGLVMRRRPHKSYAIFYYLKADKHVVIARILHSARDHERLLFPEA